MEQKVEQNVERSAKFNRLLVTNRPIFLPYLILFSIARPIVFWKFNKRLWTFELSKSYSRYRDRVKYYFSAHWRCNTAGIQVSSHACFFASLYPIFLLLSWERSIFRNRKINRFRPWDYRNHTHYTQIMWNIKFQIVRCHSTRLICHFYFFFLLYYFFCNIEISRFLEIIK